MPLDDQRPSSIIGANQKRLGIQRTKTHFNQPKISDFRPPSIADPRANQTFRTFFNHPNNPNAPVNSVHNFPINRNKSNNLSIFTEPIPMDTYITTDRIPTTTAPGQRHSNWPGSINMPWQTYRPAPTPSPSVISGSPQSERMGFTSLRMLSNPQQSFAGNNRQPHASEHLPTEGNVTNPPMPPNRS